MLAATEPREGGVPVGGMPHPGERLMGCGEEQLRVGMSIKYVTQQCSPEAGFFTDMQAEGSSTTLVLQAASSRYIWGDVELAG